MVILWIVIGVIVLLGLFFIRFEHQARRIKLILIVVFLLLLYFSISTVLNSDKVSLNSPDGIINAIYVYVSWLGETVGSLWDIGVDTAHTVGNAVKVNNTVK